MAVVQNTLIGRASGQVGNTIFQKWKSLNIIRSMPVSVANPNTPAQQLHRAKISVLGKFYKNAKPIIDVGVKDYTRNTVASAVFQKWNIKTALIQSGPNQFIPNPDRFIISKGKMGKTHITNMAIGGSAGNNFVSVSWDASKIPHLGSSGDRVTLIIYRYVTDELRIGFSGTRLFGSAVLYFQDDIATNEAFMACLYFRNDNGSPTLMPTSLVSDNSNGFYVVP